MMRFAYVISTLVIGVIIQIALTHYLSLYDAAPQVLLLLTAAHGFMFGPIMGEVLGFSWGLMSDASGTRLFGLNTFLLALAGYIAGKLRRRVASERQAPQLVISVILTTYYAIGMSQLYGLFDEAGHRFSLLHFILEIIYNGLFVSILFYLTERWIELWRIPEEHL